MTGERKASDQSTEGLRRQDPSIVEVQRKWPLISGIAALLLVFAAGGLIALREVVPYEVDSEWMDELYAIRTPFLENVARVFDWLGGGVVGVFVVPIAIAVALFLARRRWAAFYFLAASVASALVVQLIKNLVGRPRPEEILVTADFGSFPSGHTANAATIAVVLGIVLRRWWIWFAGAIYVTLMLLSRNYLGAHWLTDTLGGLLVGIAMALIVWAPFALRLHRETLRARGVPAEDPAGNPFDSSRGARGASS